MTGAVLENGVEPWVIRCTHPIGVMPKQAQTEMFGSATPFQASGAGESEG